MSVTPENNPSWSDDDIANWILRLQACRKGWENYYETRKMTDEEKALVIETICLLEISEKGFNAIFVDEHLDLQEIADTIIKALERLYKLKKMWEGVKDYFPDLPVKSWEELKALFPDLPSDFPFLF